MLDDPKPADDAKPEEPTETPETNQDEAEKLGDPGKKALAEERARAKALEKELKDLRTKAEQAEREKLEEQGKYKEIAEKKDRELQELKAKQDRAEFVESVRKTFTDNEIPEYADAVLALQTAKTSDDMLAAFKPITEKIDATVERLVDERLKTGKRPGSAEPSPTTADQYKEFYPSMAE